MVLFVISISVLLGFVYWSTIRFVNEQIDDAIEAEVDELRKLYRRSGLNALRQIIAQRAQASDDTEHIYLLAGPHYLPIVGNLRERSSISKEDLGWVNATVSVRDDDDEQPNSTGVRAQVIQLPGGFRLLIGRDLEDFGELHEHTLQVLAVTVCLSLILALTGGLAFSRTILRRIETINFTSRSIMAGELEKRISVTGSGDEFDQLAANLNAMLAKIQQLMDGMRQVTDNVAHDLRSPLNRLRTRLEVTLLTGRSDKQYRAEIEQTLSDVDRLLSTFNALLSIAQIESGVDRGNWEFVDLSALVRDVADLYEPLAEEGEIAFIQDTAEGLRLYGNGHLLTQAIANLLDNAIKYTPRGGKIEIASRAHHKNIEVTVKDTGPGIAAEKRDMVLERFVRLEASRTTPGNGLGLSMVHAVARLHGAKLELDDNNPGLSVRLLFAENVIATEPKRVSNSHQS